MKRGAALRDHRYLILAEGYFGPETSKTANSAIRYLPEQVAAVIDTRTAGRTAGGVLGFGGDIPVLATLDEALARNATALLIGIAPQGGRLPDAWRPVLGTAMAAGLDIVSGLHAYLSDDPQLSGAAERSGVSIVDLRKPPPDLPVSTGKAKDVDAYVVLTVGTDCNIGKMTAALQIRDALEAKGTGAGFAPTGQTGILIEGWGIAVDAVVADFIAGAAERLVLEAAADNDLVLVEGQGSLVHPGYSGVTMGLLHGSMPDAMILCHQPSRKHPFTSSNPRAYSWMRLPSVTEMIAICERTIAPLRESRVIAIALNTYDLDDQQAADAVQHIGAETGLTTTDPVRFGAGPLAAAILEARAGRREVARTG